MMILPGEAMPASGWSAERRNDPKWQRGSDTTAGTGLGAASLTYDDGREWCLGKNRQAGAKPPSDVPAARHCAGDLKSVGQSAIRRPLEMQIFFPLAGL